MDVSRNCCQTFYTYPISRGKLIIIGGGILCTLLVGVLLIIILSGGDDENPVTEIGRDALKYVPLIIGHNGFAANLKKYSKNHLKDFNFFSIDKNKGWENCTNCKTDLTLLKNGMVGNQIWSISPNCDSIFRDAVALTVEQIDVIQRLIAANIEHISLVSDSKGIMEAFKEKKLSSLIAIEGGHSIDSRLAVLRTYYNLGVRSLTLGYCTDELPVPWINNTVGLRDFGKVLVNEMNRLGMIVDISRLPKPVQLHILELSKAPVIIGNTNAFGQYNHSSNAQDDVLVKLKIKQGVIMISFDSDLVSAEKNATINDLIAHINYIRNITGPEHIGIGGGFDGFNTAVAKLDNSSQYPVLFDALLKGGVNQTKWTLKELEGLAGKNYLRVLKSVEEKALELQKTESPYDDYETRDNFNENLTSCYSDFNERY